MVDRDAITEQVRNRNGDPRNPAIPYTVDDAVELKVNTAKLDLLTWLNGLEVAGLIALIGWVVMAHG